LLKAVVKYRQNSAIPWLLKTPWIDTLVALFGDDLVDATAGLL
jgi:hypothetical protein